MEYIWLLFGGSHNCVNGEAIYSATRYVMWGSKQYSSDPLIQTKKK